MEQRRGTRAEVGAHVKLPASLEIPDVGEHPRRTHTPTHTAWDDGRKIPLQFKPSCIVFFLCLVVSFHHKVDFTLWTN